MCTIDEDIVTLDVPVNDGGIVGMEILKTFEDLPRPSLDNLGVGDLKLMDEPRMD